MAAVVGMGKTGLQRSIAPIIATNQHGKMGTSVDGRGIICKISITLVFLIR